MKLNQPHGLASYSFRRGAEAMRKSARIIPRAHDQAGAVDPRCRGRCRPRHIERGVAATSEQETVIDAWEKAPSHDVASVVDPRGGAAGGAGHVKRGVAAVHIQQEAVLRA